MTPEETRKEQMESLARVNRDLVQELTEARDRLQEAYASVDRLSQEVGEMKEMSRAVLDANKALKEREREKDNAIVTLSVQAVDLEAKNKELEAENKNLGQALMLLSSKYQDSPNAGKEFIDYLCSLSSKPDSDVVGLIAIARHEAHDFRVREKEKRKLSAPENEISR